MSARTIREVRAMLAEQACELDERTPPLARTFSFLLTPRPSPPSRERAIPLTESYASLSPPLRPSLLGAARSPILGACGNADPGSDPGQVSALPPELELSGFSPRRSEFGQRLHHPQERRLGEALEYTSLEDMPETLIQPATADEQIREIKLRRPLLGPRSFHAADAETPFFPSDLADEPATDPSPTPMTAPAPAPVPALISLATEDNADAIASGALALAKTFHLADLAARLAAEEMRIADRLANVSEARAGEAGRTTESHFESLAAVFAAEID